MQKSDKISVTLVTGFLGSGKTTLINRILSECPETVFAVVENELGAVSIDGKLLKGVNASHLFELKNGCICCTITDEYEQVLIELAERFPDIQHLLIESTGVADPGEVLRPFFQNNELRRLYDFFGTIAVADASRIDFLIQQPIALQQLAIASMIVVSKMEKSALSDSLPVFELLRQTNPTAIIGEYWETKSGRLLGNYWKDLSVRQFLPLFTAESGSHYKITSRTCYFNQPVNRRKFEDWISYQLDINRNSVFRAKGILYFENEPFEYYLQAVGVGYEIIEGGLKDALSSGAVVFIGDLTEANITEFDFSE